jgi:hypothetical protein
LSISILLLALPVRPQTAPPTPAQGYRIAGKIVNAATGEPLRRATVAALTEEDSQTVATVESDSEGHFSLEHLTAAKYQLTASKRGFRTAFYDEHDEFNSAIVTGPDQDTEHLTFRLVACGAIHGVVLTDGGDPVEHATVMLFLKPHDGRPGNRVNQTDGTTTDDTGAYEFSDLAAGDYLLAVSAEPWYALHRSSNAARKKAESASGEADPLAALDVAYPTTYFDSTTDEASASQIPLTGGARVEADINLHAVPAIRIQVDTPRKRDGGAARAELRQTVFGAVISAQSMGAMEGFLGAMDSGVAEFTGVAPGRYELAEGDPPRVVELNATANLQVDPSLGSPAVPVRGSLRTPGGAPLTDDCNLTLEPLTTEHSAENNQDAIRTQCIQGSFRFPAVPSGEWQLSGESGGRPLPIESIMVNGQPRRGGQIKVQDQPLSIVAAVAQGATRVQGFARRAGKGVAGVMVVLVPKDAISLTALYRRDQSDSDGSFSLRDVTPGRYTLVAIEDGWTLDWADPRIIGRYLPGGIPVTVSDTSGKTLALAALVPVQSR